MDRATFFLWGAARVSSFGARQEERSDSAGQGNTAECSYKIIQHDNDKYSFAKGIQNMYFFTGSYRFEHCHWAGRDRALIVFYRAGQPVFLTERGLHL